MQPRISKKKIRELKIALNPYHEHWEEWIISPACFLTRREVDVILLFRRHKSILPVAVKLNISITRAYEILNRAINRLKWNHKFYEHWLDEKMLEGAGAYDKMSEQEKFLNTPLFYHNLPAKLYNILSPHGESMGEILSKFDEKGLLRLKGFGKKKLGYLKEILNERGCISYLKGSRKEKPEKILQIV